MILQTGTTIDKRFSDRIEEDSLTIGESNVKFTEDKIFVTCRQLREQMMVSAIPATRIQYQACGYKTGHQPPEDGYVPFEAGMRLSGVDAHYWFHMELHTPILTEHQRVALSVTTGREGQWDATNPQGLIYLNGAIAQGLDVNHTQVALESDKDYTVDLYFYTGMQGGGMDFIPEVQLTDRRIEELYYDLWVPYMALEHLDPESQDYLDIIKPLSACCDRIRMSQVYSEGYFASIVEAHAYLQANFYEAVCGNSRQTIACVGHTHIDVAWLWTLAQTREKAQRSFATVLRLMEDHPEYRFMASQPQLYQYVKEEAPELYSRIQERVREGRWEPEGAMWLEADCNLTSGESLVRQILHGKRFMKQEFGVDSRILWLPDVFGYSAALPQILRKSGVDYFVTSKISWNDTNTMPYDSFDWEGIDGSEVFTVFITTQPYPGQGKKLNYVNYNGEMSPLWIKGTYERFHHKEYTDRVLNCFGFGDGGGGPTREMLQMQRRMAYGLPGYPKTEMTSLKRHLDLTRQEFRKNAELLRRKPHWTGELYLEFHRGTYTSVGRNKRNNRRSEMALQKLEGLATICDTLADQAYPAQQFDALWRTVLKNQFHDIIPGSSITQVYVDSDQEYAQLEQAFTGLQQQYLDALASQVESEGGILVYNPLGITRRGTIRWGNRTVETDPIPAYGWKVIRCPQMDGAVQVSTGERKIENIAYILSLDEKGRISSLFDKRFGREVLQKGSFGNELQLFEDEAKEFDAWEIAPFYSEKPIIWEDEAQIEPVYDGCRAGFSVRRLYHESVMEQKIWLYDSLERIDFETEILWQERHHLMKVAFPLDIHTHQATYEIQFGSVQRPTYANTSWDAAKFEVCGHKWADMSEGNYGVSVLNDCKYGWSAEGSTLKLTLLKSSTYPAPDVDKGHHKFTYSLLPHGGDYRVGRTIEEAYCLNQPLIYTDVSSHAGTLPQQYSFLSCSAENVVVETLKRAEDNNGIVVRLYEAHDCKGTAELTCGFPFREAYLCDLMENELQQLPTDGRTVCIPVSNYEILTIKFR